jgi:hypothetical protein
MAEVASVDRHTPEVVADCDGESTPEKVVRPGKDADRAKLEIKPRELVPEVCVDQGAMPCTGQSNDLI